MLGREMGTNFKPGYKIFDHTADIGLQIYGSSIDEIFKFGAEGMFSIIFHGTPPKIEAKGEYQIKLNTDDLEQLFVNWLDEVLFIFSTEQIVLSSFKIELNINPNNYSLNANVSGEIVADDKLLGAREIKAVTYHMLSVKQMKNGHWEAKVLFDI